MLVGNGSGGCCDCGDPEAFNPGTPRCGIHVVSTPDKEIPPLPQEIRGFLKETIQTALDFVIDVFSTTPLAKEDAEESRCNENAEWAELDYGILSQQDEKEYGDWIRPFTMMEHTLTTTSSHNYAVSTRCDMKEEGIWQQLSRLTISDANRS